MITFSKAHGSARPGQSFSQTSRPGPARRGPSHNSEARETWALYGPPQQIRGPARGFDEPADVPAHVLSRNKRRMSIRWHDILFVKRWFTVVFFGSGFRGAAVLPMKHTLYSHSSAPPTTRSDGFLWTTASSWRDNARSSNARCCCNTRCFNTFYRTKR